MLLVDIGVNLAHDSYAGDRDAVIARAAAAGVAQLIVTGATLTSSRAALELARAHPGRLFATAGVHPHQAGELTAGVFAHLRAQALAPLLPAGRLLLESDGPYLRPRLLRPRPASRRNEPAFLRHIAAIVARLREESHEACAAHTTAAARALFSLAAVQHPSATLA